MSTSKKTSMVLGSAAAGLLLLGAATVPAVVGRHGGRFGGFGGGGFIRALESLDLTEDQKTQVKAILRDERPAVEPLVDASLSTRKGLAEAIHAPAFDERAVRAAAAASNRASTELAVARARILSRFRDVLTDSQKERLDAMQREFATRVERRVRLGRSIWREHADDFIDAL